MKILKPNIFYRYPFEFEFLKENIDDINWTYVIWNENIDWNVDMFNLLRTKLSSEYNLNIIFRNSKISSNTNIVLHSFEELNSTQARQDWIDFIEWNEDILNDLNGRIDLSSVGEMLNTSTKYLESHSKELDWSQISCNGFIIWTDEFIENNLEKFDWDGLSFNSKLPWTIELISKYEDYWNWDLLSQNSSVKWTEHLISNYDRKVNWDRLSYNPNIEISKVFIEENLDKLDIRGISRNTKIDWSFDFIEKYKDELNFGNYGLSWNFKLPWSKDLLLKYLEYWSWSGISSNRGIPWNLDILTTYDAYLIWGKNDDVKNSADEGHMSNGFCLSNNPSLPWSIELIDKFSERYESTYSNLGIWSKVIKPVINSEDELKKMIKA